MKTIWTLALKDVRLLLRDRTGSIFVFLYPIVIAVFMGKVFSGNQGDTGAHTSALPVSVVDQDSTEMSRHFLETLAQSGDLQTAATDLAQAIDDVRLGKKAAFIVIQRGYGEARGHIFNGRAPGVEVGIDPSHRAEAGLITGALLKSSAKEMQAIFSDRNLMRRQVQATMQSLQSSHDEESAGWIEVLSSLDKSLADTNIAATGGSWAPGEPLTIHETIIVRQRTGPPSSFAVTFPQGIMWGIISCVTTFALSLVTERNSGTLLRLTAAPLRSSQILGSKALVCFITTMAVSIVAMLIGIVAFDVRVGSYGTLALGLTIVSASFVGVMMLLSVFGKTERAAGNIGWVVMLLFAMIGGCMVPLFFMPEWLKTLSNISPVKWGILALEGALWRDFTFQELLVPYGILVGFGSVSFVLGVRLFRWSDQG